MSREKILFSDDAVTLSSCMLRKLVKREDAVFISEHLIRMDPWRLLGYSQNGLIQYLLRDDPALKRYMIVQNEEKIGIVCIRYPWLRGPCMELIGLFELYQGQGIGKKIIQWIEKESEAVSKNIWVFVSEFNKNAICFYERAGFVKNGSIHDLIKPGFEEFLYRKMI